MKIELDFVQVGSLISRQINYRSNVCIIAIINTI